MMTTDSMACSINPTSDELDTLVEDVLLAAHHGGWPMFVMDNFGETYCGHFLNGEQYFGRPWQIADNRFVATDSKGRIHWMHPAMQARISCLDEYDFYAEVSITNRLQYLSRKETANALSEHCLEMLIKLRNRQAKTGPAYAAIRSLTSLGKPSEAERHLLEMFQEAGISADLGWSLSQVALSVARVEGSDALAGECPFVRSVILGHLTDPKVTPVPDAQSVHQALVALKVARASEDVSWGDAVYTVAAAVAHSILPKETLQQLGSKISDVEITIARINRGDFDPKVNREPATFEASLMEDAIFSLLYGERARSAHERFELVLAANGRLKSIGSHLSVNLDACQRMASKADEIPF